MNSCKFIMLWLGILASLPIYSQKKYEREYTIKPSAVPEKAREFINQCFPDQKIKWYGEESFKSQSIEAKVKKGGSRYSVEFDNKGNLQDAEVIIAFTAIPDNLREKVVSYLRDQFSKHHILKVQRQWKGPADALQALIKEQKTDSPYETNYEIIVRGVNKEGTSLYETLFNQQGKLIRSSQIVQKNANHLIY